MSPKIKDIRKIYTKYPKLFRKNCITCHNGWCDIIDQMCSTIQVYIDNEIYDKKIQPEFVYIKEKFGVLDIEIKDGDEIVGFLKKSCEKLSCHTCEYCGELGELYCSSKHRNWSILKTLCLDHAIELYFYKLYKQKE